MCCHSFVHCSSINYRHVISGLLWTECKQMYSSGIRVYLLDNYNWIDFLFLSLYLASYALRFLVDHWIKEADQFYNGTARAREALLTRDFAAYGRLYQEIFRDTVHSSKSYFMQACEYEQCSKRGVCGGGEPSWGRC